MEPRICAVFDIDDTLYLERNYVRSGFQAVGQWTAQNLGLTEFSERCWSLFLSGERRSIFNLALRQLGDEPSSDLIANLVGVYRRHVPAIALARDAADALDIIARTTTVAVITDGPAESQARKAEALNLGAVAEPIVLTALLGNGYSKPHTKAFEFVTNRHPASVYVYIADNPLKDFQAPRRLGWATIRVRRPGGLHYERENSEIVPDFEVHDCTTVPELLKRI